MVHDPGQRPQQRRLARTDRADDQHQLAALDGQVDVLRADRAVLVHRAEAVQLQPPQRVARRGRRRRRGAGRDVHARAPPTSTRPTPAIATVRRVHTRADGKCDTSDAVVQANHRAAPSVATAISVAAGGQVAGQVHRPGRDRQQAADDRRGGPRPHLDRDLPALPLAAVRVQPGQVVQHRHGRAGQLHRARRGQRRHQRGGERRAGRHGTPGGPLQPRPEQGRGQPGDHHRADEEQRRHERPGRPRHRHDHHQADGLVDQVVGQHDHPLGVAALRHHLGRGVLADPARADLAVHQPQADPQHLPDPPLREPGAGVVQRRDRQQQAGRDAERRVQRVAHAVDHVRPEQRQDRAVQAEQDQHRRTSRPRPGRTAGR